MSGVQSLSESFKPQWKVVVHKRKILSDQKRLNLGDDRIDSIRVKTLPTKENERPVLGRWDKIFWVPLNIGSTEKPEYILVNINSLVKRTGLTRSAILNAANQSEADVKKTPKNDLTSVDSKEKNSLESLLANAIKIKLEQAQGKFELEAAPQKEASLSATFQFEKDVDGVKFDKMFSMPLPSKEIFMNKIIDLLASQHTFLDDPIKYGFKSVESYNQFLHDPFVVAQLKAKVKVPQTRISDDLYKKLCASTVNDLLENLNDEDMKFINETYESLSPDVKYLLPGVEKPITKEDFQKLDLDCERTNDLEVFLNLITKKENFYRFLSKIQ